MALTGDTRDGEVAPPRRLTKDEFAHRLSQLMAERGWKQSELGRRSGLPRDSISVYVRGVSLPNSRSLDALANAFGIQPWELLPNYVEGAVDGDQPIVEIKGIADRPGHAWLHIRREMPMRLALQIASLIDESGHD